MMSPRCVTPFFDNRQRYNLSNRINAVNDQNLCWPFTNCLEYQYISRMCELKKSQFSPGPHLTQYHSTAVV